MVKMQENNPTYNIQMMMAEPHEEDQSINIVTRSGTVTSAEKDKQPEDDGWVRKVAEKEIDLDLNHAK